ncbi:hypothetical protein BGZ83_005733 [Gryganskiella cystojenkinii]|nr:hypothetical protein BGZ83_005733 [Gryganskiella cystojenkinii]
MAMEDSNNAAERAGPRKLMSEENLKVVSNVGGVVTGRRQVLSSPPAPNHSTAPLIPPRSSSRQSSFKGSQQPQDGQTQHSTTAGGGVCGMTLATKSSTSSITSLRDANNGSLSTMTDSLSIRSPDTMIQGRRSLVPPPQRSTPSSSNNSISSRANSPVPFQNHQGGLGFTAVRNELESPLTTAATTTTASRPATPSQGDVGAMPSKSKARQSGSRRQSLEDSGAQLRQEQTQEQQQQSHQEHDHYLNSVLDDIRSKTHHVLQKAGFSMAPNAGLFSDRGSKEIDLTVVQIPQTTTLSPSTTPVQMSVDTDALSVAGSTATGVSFAPSTVDSNHTVDKEKSKPRHGIFGRPRSRSVKEGGLKVIVPSPPPLLSSRASDQGRSASPEPFSPSAMSMFEKLRPWAKSEQQRQRSNSGPARHSDSILLRQKLEEAQQSQMSIHLKDTDPNNRSAAVTRPPRQRRISEATVFTTTSSVSTKSCPLPPPPPSSSSHQHQSAYGQMSSLSQVISTSSSLDTKQQKRRSKNWFGIPKRSSAQSVEDTRKPHVLGHGIEGGIMPSRDIAAMLDEEDDEDGDDFDGAETDYHEEDEDGDEDDLGSSRDGHNSRLFVNDYGFVYDLDDEMNQGQDLTGNGSSVGVDGSNLSTVSDHDRKRAIRKQKHNRENELKWIHAATRLNADHIKKSTKYKKLVRKGIPTSVRGRVWLFLSKADFYRQPGLFEQLQKRPALPIHEVIERDIHRCYPDHIHFRDGMGGTGQQDLHAVLKAYAHYKPSVGYCQGMGRLVGMMLMQMPVEDAFWLLVATIEGYMQDYYTPTLRQLRIDAQVFERLLKDQDPMLAEHLEKNDVIPLMYMTQWFMTLFTMSLPWASVLRVWDVFYFDGCKALFRVGLAILQLCREHLLNKCPTSSELLAYILHIPLEILGPKPLLEAALQIKLRRHSVQKLIAVTAESMDAKAASQEREREKEKSLKERKSRQQEEGSKEAHEPVDTNPMDTQSLSHNQEQSPAPAAAQRPVSGSAVPRPTSLSSGQSPSFSPLGVFKTRKRAGTMHK